LRRGFPSKNLGAKSKNLQKIRKNRSFIQISASFLSLITLMPTRILWFPIGTPQPIERRELGTLPSNTLPARECDEKKSTLEQAGNSKFPPL
jgi:hypothetical protein